MTKSVPTPGGDDESEEAVLKAAEEILFGEAELTSLESIFGLAVRVGVFLNNWQELMGEKYSPQWVEETAMILFNKYFTPFVPPWEENHDD